MVREYVGGGLLGQLAAEMDRLERLEREREAEARREESERLGALAAPVEELCEAAEVLVRAHLVAGGCHRRKGEWRRARGA